MPEGHTIHRAALVGGVSLDATARSLAARKIGPGRGELIQFAPDAADAVLDRLRRLV